MNPPPPVINRLANCLLHTHTAPNLRVLGHWAQEVGPLGAALLAESVGAGEGRVYYGMVIHWANDRR